MLAATCLLLALSLLPTALSAQEAAVPGPVIFSTGAVFPIPDADYATPPDLDYHLAFEVGQASPSPNQLNAALNSVARFLNMHVQAGVPRERVRAAVVVHGTAGWEILDESAYRERYGVANPNRELIGELLDNGVQVILCGQTATSRGIPDKSRIKGVQVALSAMTAFVVLQEQGYRVNPW
jgi:intracellular sulfur oxidation DsrE/DsrF family protein